MIEWVPFWDVNRQGRGVVQSARCARVPDVVDRAGCCEFVGALVDDIFDGRRCKDGTFCPSRCYSVPSVYASCPTRIDKLKGRKEKA
jgi:hypothetical protein